MANLAALSPAEEGPTTEFRAELLQQARKISQRPSY
jgi:hypothetical protein